MSPLLAGWLAMAGVIAPLIAWGLAYRLRDRREVRRGRSADGRGWWEW